VICNQDRGGLDNLGYPSSSGFGVDFGSLPDSYAGKQIWFTFDQAGEWPLPQSGATVVPAKKAGYKLTYKGQAPNHVVPFDNFHQQIQSAPVDLQNHWRALEDFRVFLDGLEHEISRRDQLLRSKQELDLAEADHNHKTRNKLQSKGLIRFFRRSR